MKKLKVVLLFIIMLFSVLLTGCQFFKDDEPEKEYVTVTFDVLGEKTETEVEVGTKVSKPKNPNVNGQSFTGWFLGENEYDFNMEVNENLDLVAKFEKLTYTVEIVNSVTKEKQVLTVDWGQKIEKPEDPVVEGYDFVRFDCKGKEFDFNTEIKDNYTINEVFTVKKYKVEFYIDDELFEETSVNYDFTIKTQPKAPVKEGYVFVCWMNGDKEFNFDERIKSDLRLDALYEKVTYKVTFMVDDNKFDEVNVEANAKVSAPTNPTKSGYTFVCWKRGDFRFNFDAEILENITLTAEFASNSSIIVEYDFGHDCSFQTKDDLRFAFYSDFYYFMKNNNFNFSKYNIKSLEEFLVAMDTFNWNNGSEMNTIGYAFANQFMSRSYHGTLENQTESSFLGWCYRNNKYIDFIHHLEVFFKYWRIDEGWAQSEEDTRAKFYDDTWSAMVDTAKFFYFNGDTLQTRFNGIYKWFDSERVHYALDNIPGVGCVTLTYVSDTEIILPTAISWDNHQFSGWFDEDGNRITKVTSSMKVTAHWDEGELPDPGDDPEPEPDELAELAEDFLKDFNQVLGKSYDDPAKLDTDKLESSYMVTFGNNQAMTTKWMWLYKALADINNNPDAYPDREGFSWDSYKGFYLANLNGLFTRTKHKDTYLGNESVDFSVESNVEAVLNYDKLTVLFKVDSTNYKVLMVEKGSKATKPTDPVKEGYNFICWKNGESEFDFNTIVNGNLSLTAYFEKIKYTVTFNADGSKYKEVQVESGSKVTKPADPTKEGYNFVCWRNGESEFNFNTAITDPVTLTAYFEKVDTSIKVTYDFGYDCFQTKDDLRIAFYTDFYTFLVGKGHGSFTVTAGSNNIGTFTVNDVNSFIEFMDTWQIGDKKEMGFIGNELGSYYLTKDPDGVLENQPDTTFVGWCYKNNKYRDVLAHLVEFFAYWRTDEGYTTPTNHGNDFFYDSWAAMVDTAKFFHFNGDTLQTKNNGMYSWFDSERVHYALDHIPGVGRVTLVYTDEEFITLPTDITRPGYTFVGWYNESGELVTVVNKSGKVTAHWNEVKEEPKSLEEIAAVFLKDFNQLLGKSYDDPSKLDTLKLESSYMITFGSDQAMSKKWMWLYKAIADLNENTNAYPDREGFNWDSYKGFYLANLNGLFTRTQHKDTYLGNVSADFSDEDNVNAILNYDKITVRFKVDDNNYKVFKVESGLKVTKPADPTKEGYNFVCWKNGESEFDFDTVITGPVTLTAYFEEIVSGAKVTYDFGYDCFQTKEDLKVAYYTDFYNFLIAQGYDSWSDYEIENVEDFLEFMDTFKWNDRNEMGTIGTAFGSYYLAQEIGGKLENQPENKFLGWCYKNNKYIDFIHHLEVFFAYWRTDEGYSKTDPNGNDFYASAWASMVDTAKFFYFNGDTLQTKFNAIYSWFDSERVHYALDHIPGVGRVTLVYTDEESITLPLDITRPGYTFKGWVDSNSNPVTFVTSSMTVHATWEKTIKIVYTVRAEAKSNLTSGSETNWYCATPSQATNGYLWGHRLVLVADGVNYKVSQIMTGDGKAIEGDYAYRIINYDGGYKEFSDVIKVGQTVTATVDGDYIIFNFYE